jgi:hypothetical protein
MARLGQQGARFGYQGDTVEEILLPRPSLDIRVPPHDPEAGRRLVLQGNAIPTSRSPRLQRWIRLRREFHNLYRLFSRSFNIGVALGC